MVSMLMVLLVLGSVVLGIVLSGVGFDPFVSVESLLVMVVFPLAMVAIGTRPRAIVQCFKNAISPASASDAELRSSRALLVGWGRLLAVSAALYASIGLIAMSSSLGPGAGEELWYLGPGIATMARSVFYALLLHVLVVQPLRIRVERSLAAFEGSSA